MYFLRLLVFANAMSHNRPDQRHRTVSIRDSRRSRTPEFNVKDAAIWDDETSLAPTASPRGGGSRRCWCRAISCYGICLQQKACAVTQDASSLSRLVEFRGKCMYAIIVVERVHRPLAANEQNRVVVADLSVGSIERERI